MRQTMTGLVAAIALVTASAAPALACGPFGACSPCGAGYVGPCAPTYVPAYTYFDRLADPVQQYHAAAPLRHQYYYVNQGPTYTGPGAFAPYPAYEEATVYGWGGYRHRGRHHRMHRYD